MSFSKFLIFVSILTTSFSFSKISFADLNGGLLLHYPFENNATDATGNGNNGVVFGDMEYTQGVLGQAASFDGIDDRILVSNSQSILLGDSFSVSFWAQFNNAPGPHDYYFFNKYSDQTETTREVAMFITTGSEGRVCIDHTIGVFDTSARCVLLQGPQPVATWQHYASTYSSGDLLYYINGQLVGSNTSVAHTTGSGEISLGIYPPIDWHTHGKMDDLRIYDRALTPEEISQLASGEIVPLCNGLTPTIVGTNGNDTIIGTDGDDVIVGLKGNDTIEALAGADTVCGNQGNDTILGGDGADHLRGGKGNDTIEGNKGDDVIRGRNGNDTLQGGKGNDSIRGDEGNDTCSGGNGTDTDQECEVTDSTEATIG